MVRKIENTIDFNFIYDKVKGLIKIVLIQYLFGIPSMRQTIREIEVNVAYRWFLGYSLTEKIPHFSTFNKNYERRFKNTDLFESIFKEILATATECGFIDSSNIYIDSTHIKASTNKKIKVNSKQHTLAIAVDAGYITPYICKTILDDDIITAIPYKRYLLSTI